MTTLAGTPLGSPAVNIDTRTWTPRALLRATMESRMVEERITDAQLIPDHHSGVNYEAIGVGVGAAVRFDDPVQTGYRSGAAVGRARGMNIRNLVLQGFGLIPSCRTQVAGGPRILRSTGILGGNIPTAAGVALASRLRGDDRVIVQFTGDGASNQGAVHEVYNIAAAKKLPMVLILENNGIAMTIRAEDFRANHDLSLRGAAYGIPAASVDGSDVFEVYRATTDAVQRAREGGGPILLEMRITRPSSHATIVAETRSGEEVEAARSINALRVSAGRLLESGDVSQAEIDEWSAEIEREIDAAFEEAREQARTKATWVYGGQISRAQAWRLAHATQPPTWMED